MKKKLLGTVLTALGACYFLALFYDTQRFEAWNETLSYLCFLAAVLCLTIGVLLLLLRSPQQYERERAEREKERQLLKKHECCSSFDVYVLLGLNLVAYAVVQRLQGEQGVLLYAVSKHERSAYRFVTAMFVHVDAVHLLGNMAALYYVGKRLESLIGHARFAAIYLLGGLGASGTLALLSAQPCVGASGAVFALTACLLPIAWKNRRCIRHTFWKELLPSAAIDFLLSFLLPNVSAPAHLTGFALGAVGYYLFCTKLPLDFSCESAKICGEEVK